MCNFCNVKFMWDLGKDIELCPGCRRRLKIKDTKMSSYSYSLYVKEQKKKLSSTDIFGVVKKRHATYNTPDRKYKGIPAKEEGHERKGAVKEIVIEEKPGYFHVPRTMLGKYTVLKNKARHGTVELTNPDYMILKVNLWCMGDNQKQMILELNNMIKNYLIEREFTLRRK